jgi:hypothetical protein
VWEFHVEQERQGCYLGMKRPLEGNFSDTFALRYSLELWNAVSPQRVDSGSFEPIPVGPAVIQ